MPTSRVSGNQIENTTNATLNALDFAGNSGELKLPTGTEAQRPASAAIGMLRFSTTEDKVEQYVISGPGNAPGWVKVKGGGSGGGLGAFGLIKGNPKTIEETISIPANTESPVFSFDGCFTVGPVITITSGNTVTVGLGVDYTIIGGENTMFAVDAGGAASKLGPGWMNIGSDDGLGEFNLIRGNPKTIDQTLIIPFNAAANEFAFEKSVTVGPNVTISSGNTITVSSGVTYEIL